MGDRREARQGICPAPDIKYIFENVNIIII